MHHIPQRLLHTHIRLKGNYLPIMNPLIIKVGGGTGVGTAFQRGGQVQGVGFRYYRRISLTGMISHLKLC